MRGNCKNPRANFADFRELREPRETSHGFLVALACVSQGFSVIFNPLPAISRIMRVRNLSNLRGGRTVLILTPTFSKVPIESVVKLHFSG